MNPRNIRLDDIGIHSRMMVEQDLYYSARAEFTAKEREEKAQVQAAIYAAATAQGYHHD